MSGRRRDGRAGAARRRRAVGALLGVLVLLSAPSTWIWVASAGHVDTLESASDTTAPVAIVLGARVYDSGRPSPWLTYRLDAAAELYLSGRVDALLVSGDGREGAHDEPGTMRDYLVDAGVPPQAVVLDTAGYDTYDTCVRAHEVFGVSQALVVTQDFHAPRAVTLCRQAGIDAQGVADTRARANRTTWVRSWVRERVAAFKAVWDVLSGRDPVLGAARTDVEEAVSWTRAHRDEQAQGQ